MRGNGDDDEHTNFRVVLTLMRYFEEKKKYFVSGQVTCSGGHVQNFFICKSYVGAPLNANISAYIASTCMNEQCIPVSGEAFQIIGNLGCMDF